MSTATQNVAESLSRRSLRPWKLIILGIVILPFFLFFNWHLYIHYAGSGDLAAAIAEADRLDPGWRLEEVNARREEIPDAENSALQIIKIVGTDDRRTGGLIPPKWESELFDLIPPRWYSELGDKNTVGMTDHSYPPNHRYPDVFMDLIREELAKIPAGVAEAREKLADMPRGLYPPSERDPLGGHFYLEGISTLNHVFPCDVEVLSMDGKNAEAFRSIRAFVNALRSYGDDNRGMDFWPRMICWISLVNIAERALAQGEAAESDLLSLQRMLAEEENVPVMLHSLRFHRVEQDRFNAGILNGKTNRDEVLHMIGGVPEWITWWRAFDLDFLDAVCKDNYIALRVGPLTKPRALLLKHNTAAVEIFKLPIEQQNEAMDRFAADFEKKLDDQPLLVRYRAARFSGWYDGYRFYLSRLRCLIAGLAIERYRLAHGHWPQALSDVVPRYLPAVPLDPYLNKPMQYIRVADGVVIYAVGSDKTDNGGNLRRKWNNWPAKADEGIQLWDVAERRKPAK